MGGNEDVDQAQETVQAIQKQLAEIQAEFEVESAELASRTDPMSEVLDTVLVKPKKADIVIQLAALTWAPYFVDTNGIAEPAW